MKKRIYCLIMTWLLLAVCMTDAAKANAAGAPPSESVRKPKHTASITKNTNLHYLKTKAKNYQLNYQKQILMNENATLKLEGKPEDCSVTYKSSNPSVLSVQKVSETTCTYTGESSGTATIQVRIRHNKNLFFQNKTITLKAKISVSPRAISIKFRRAKIKMTTGQKKKIKTIIRPSISKEKPVFVSSDPGIAFFQNNNVLRAKRAGSTYITASISNGMKVRCKIVVKNK